MRIRLRALGTVVVAALIAAACGGGGDDSAPASTASTASTVVAPTTTAGATTTSTSGTAAPVTTTPPSGYLRLGTPRTLVSGVLAGSAADGAVVFVEQVDDVLSQLGCEGQPDPVLFRVLVSDGTSEVVRAGEELAKGRVLSGPGGRVALVDLCEGFLSNLWVGTESPEGRLSGLTRVPLDDSGALGGFSWTRDGERLLAGRMDFEREAAAVVEIDPESGSVSELFEIDLEATSFVAGVAELADGSYVVAADGQVSIREADGSIRSAVSGFAFAVAPEGDRVAVAGDGLQILFANRVQPVPVTSEELQVQEVEYSPDGQAVAYVAFEGDRTSTQVALPADGRNAVVEGATGFAVAPTFLGTGALAFTVFPTGPGEASVVIVPLG